MADGRLELLENLVWQGERLTADKRVRGSRADTATVAGQTVSGVILAESSVRYGTAYTVGEGGALTIITRYGFGVGAIGSTFRLG